MVAVQNRAEMTVNEFQAWRPERDADRRWHLIDGKPICMAPASSDQARIVGRMTFLLTAHVDATMPGCAVLVAPGVVSTVSALQNERIPDIAITCEPASKAKTLRAPIVLIEILSPSNSAVTRKNVEAY